MTDTTTQDVNQEAEVQDTDADIANQNSEREQDSQPSGFDALPEETKSEIRKLRRENASFRKQVKGFEDAQKTDTERREEALKEAEERASKAENRAREALGRAEVMKMAPKSGAISANALYAAIQKNLTFDDETGEPNNVEEAVIVQGARALTCAGAGIRVTSALYTMLCRIVSHQMSLSIGRLSGRYSLPR